MADSVLRLYSYEVGAVDIKIVDNSDGTYSLSSAFAADPTVVLGAGTAEIGKVDAGRTHTISQQPTITAGAYSAGDAVGGKLTFANAARTSGGGGIITNLRIIDDAGQDAELELWLFDQDFTAMSDNAAWAPSEADLENWVMTISTTGDTWRSAGTPSTIDIDFVKGYVCNGTALYGQLVTRGTPTFAATDDLTAKLTMIRD